MRHRQLSGTVRLSARFDRREPTFCFGNLNGDDVTFA
jgi:hypothetical protein